MSKPQYDIDFDYNTAALSGYNYTEFEYDVTSVRRKSYEAQPIEDEDGLKDFILGDDIDSIIDEGLITESGGSGYEYGDWNSITFKKTKYEADLIGPEDNGSIFDTKDKEVDEHIKSEIDVNEKQVDIEEEFEVKIPDDDIISETVLTSKQRKRLKDEQFGLPRLRKYPLTDRRHVNMAIRFFGYTKNESDRKTLARNIVKRYKELRMTTKIGRDNPLYKYIPQHMKQASLNETTIALTNAKELEIKNNTFIPVYILLTSNPTRIGGIIRNVTKSIYNHASITTDAALDKMYSFTNKAGNKFLGGLDIESISDGALAKLKEKGSIYGLYVTFISKDKFDRIEKKLNNMIAEIDKYRYNVIGLFKYLLGIRSVADYKKFCSEFVAELLKEADDSLVSNHPSLIAPFQLITPKFYHVSSGELKKYDKKHTLNRIRSIIKSNKIVQYLTENSIFYNNLFYNKDFAKEIIVAKELKFLDNFFPSTKIDIPIRMATSLGGLYGRVDEYKTAEDLEIALEVSYNSEYNRYKINNKDLDHIKYCIKLYDLYKDILKNPIKYKDYNSLNDEEKLILYDWHMLIKYHNALLNDAEIDSDEYKIQCQHLHELLWEPGDDPSDEEIISDNILAFAEIIGEIYNINENYELLDPMQVYSYMAEKLDASEDIFLLKDLSMYPILNRQSVRMAMDIIDDIDEENIDEFVSRLNEKYILFGCRFKIPANHPYAKYADERIIEPTINLDIPKLNNDNDINESYILLDGDIESGSRILHKELDCDVLHLEDKNDNKLAISDDTELIMNESIIFDKNDLILNINKWKPNSSHNILYITGLSGSGKTTLAGKYKKDHKAYIFEIDGIQYGYDSSNLGLLSSAEKEFPRYLELRELVKSGKLSKDEYRKIQKEVVTQYINVFNFIHSEMKKRDDKLFIIEGIQLFQWISIDSLRGKPLIIKGASVVTSMSQRMKREGNGKIDWITELKNEFPQFVTMYIRHEKSLSEFKKQLNESYTFPILENQNDDLSVFDKKDMKKGDIRDYIDYDGTDEEWEEYQEKFKSLGIKPGINKALIDETIGIKQKLKSYVFDIDEEGNIMISQKENADFDKHYKNSLKLLKIYKNTNNIVGIKNELCRLYYMASIIEQYYMDYSNKNVDKDVQKDMINLRSLILNTFSFYLKSILKSDSNFDFREYFDKTLYGETLKIKKKSIEGFIKLSKAMIAAMS